MDLDFVSVHKNATEELGQYPAILTSRLVNNAWIYFYVDPYKSGKGGSTEKLLSHLGFQQRDTHRTKNEICITSFSSSGFNDPC